MVPIKNIPPPQGWPVFISEPERYKSLPKDVLHINILEFLAVFINMWLVVRILFTKDTFSVG